MRTQTTWGLNLINEVLDDPSTIKVDASDMTLHGFCDDTMSEYRQRSVILTEPGGSLTCEAPSCGLRYLGYVIYDSLSTEAVEVWINGVKHGVAVVDANNQRERLITLAEPYDFQGAEEIRLQTPQGEAGALRSSATQSGLSDLGIEGRTRQETGEIYRIECIAFFTDLPPETDLPCRFTHVHTEPLQQHSDGQHRKRAHSADSAASVRLTWVTTWDAKCKVEYWAEGSQAPAVIDEERSGANHRVVLTDLHPNTPYLFRLSATDRHGKLVECETQTFVTSPPHAVVGSTTSMRVPIAISNRGDAPYKSVPIMCGIPFPEGVLASHEHLRLLDTDGAEVPLQTRMLGQWLDYSVKWVSLDFQADVPAGSEGVYMLEYGSEIERKRFGTTLKAHEDSNTVTVDTGRLRITLDKSRFAPFAEILRDSRPYLTDSRIVVNGTDGKQYVGNNAPPESVEIEEEGPVACIVRIEGKHVSADGGPLLKSVCRIHAYAGLPFIRIDHTFVNDNSAERFTDISSMFLELDIPPGDYEETEITQTHDNRCVINGEATEERANGTIRAGGVDVGIVDFWQQYPKSLRTHKKGIEIGICPPIDADDYRDTGSDELRLYFYLKDGVYRLREGVSKTHTLYIGEDIPSQPLPVAQAPAEWYCDSGTLGEIVPARGERFADYEVKIAQAFEVFLKTHETGREYGMLNFGDWCFDNYKDWGNTEYDTAFVSFLHWVRSGDARFFEEGCRAALHHRDVDTCHASADAMSLGGVYRHRLAHTGDHHPGGYGPMEEAISSGEFPATGVWVDAVASREFRATLTWGGEFTISHTWVDGFVLHYFLTGDPRSLETARMVADRYDGHYTRNYDFTVCRNNGWHLILTMAMYQATGDRFYLNAAHIIVERTLERQTEDGGWSRMLVPGHCHCDPPRHTGNAGFMVGILLNGLKLYHQVTGDPEVSQAIVRGAEYLVDNLWRGADGFQYTDCPHSKTPVEDTSQMIVGISYAWRISRKSSFESVLRLGPQHMIDSLQPHGRLLSSAMRDAPNVLRDIGQLPHKF